ncbi:hypothetical protein P3T27_003286 [Kitasatospora sp. MAA19]|uniref:hypothetical protein n=1 Tax=Kitasatospora sp. MAA19 TaxID=3035090 RepID=UPI00247600D8|nr:hypothetical protein [Kitasatospora sp. MAA19]MDH6706559.1 hypothetical protein [Kitasatospora sp. MAA19]
MRYLAFTREAGAAWTDGQGITGQLRLEQHAAFMDTLAEMGFALFADPLSAMEQGRRLGVKGQWAMPLSLS